MSKIEEIKKLVEQGKSKRVGVAVKEALKSGFAVQDILEAMIASMGVVGERFSTGEIFVPEILIAANAMSKGVDELRTALDENVSGKWGTCIMGTVAGDLHDIGKNLVAIMLESSGFKLVDLGVDVSSERFVEAIKENDDVIMVACSGLLTTTMPALKETVQRIKGAYPEIKVIVGGAPVTLEYATEIGADGYAADAGSSVLEAKTLIASD